MGLALEDPWSEQLGPIRETVSQEIDWQECLVGAENLDEVITAALTCEETWVWSEGEHSSEEED